MTYPRAADHPILLVHEAESGQRLLDRLAGKRPLFVCTVAHTETAEIDGLSAAGATAELRRLTAAADAEALFHGRPLCMDGVPSNPLGAPGPVLITLAALRLAGIPSVMIDAGLRVKPDAPTRVIADRWGGSIVEGNAVPNAAELLATGRRIGAELAERGDYLLLAESVPGGTTTALAVLCGLGIDAWGKVSSSIPNNAHPLKNEVVRQALASAGLPEPPAAPFRFADPLRVVGGIGDPMQPVVAGLALGALPQVPVVLAGGSQMAAVLAIIVAVVERTGEQLDFDRLAIATTRWVAIDPTADLAGLVRAIGPAPVFACDLDFSNSRHPSLRRYEQFLVKEGVGAGAAAIAASLTASLSATQLLTEIEHVYDEVMGGE